MKRRKLILLLSLSALLVLLAVPLWRVWRQAQQEDLNRLWIAAIQNITREGKTQDVEAALALLRAGADPNALPLPEDSRPFWRRLWDRLRGDPPAVPLPPPVDNTTPLLRILSAAAYETGSLDSSQRYRLVQALLQHGANVEARHTAMGGETPLMFAVKSGDEKLVRLLLDYSADVNAVNDRGSPVLEQAADTSARMVDLLFERGAKLKGEQASNVLYNFSYGNMDALKALLRHDVNVREIDRRYGPLLDQQSPEAARLLMAHGADVDRKTSDGRTPLLRVLSDSSGDWRIIPALLDAGADVNAQDDHGNTPLMYAAAQFGDDDLALIRRLIALGAKVNHRSKFGKTPLQYARWHPKTVALLRQAGAKK